MARKNLLDVDIDQNDLAKAADPDVRVRDFLLNQYGDDYGITNDMIGWDNNTKTILLNGREFMKPDKVVDGTSLSTDEAIRGAFDNLIKTTGMKSNSEKYNLSNYGYDSPYSSTIDEILKSVLNPTPFNYDVNNDPKFASYKDQFGRAGDKALANTMSEATGMTGGRLNSWAVSAGNQAKQNWDEKLMDVIPQLEGLAYNRYQSELDGKRNNLNTLLDIDNDLFRRAIDNRQFDYGVGRDVLEDGRYRDETKYNRGRDALADERYNTEWDYGLERDAVEDTRYADETAWNRKMDSDASAARWAGVNLSREQFEQQKEMDQWKIDQAAKETGVEPDLFGEFYTQMYSGVIEDENGNIVKEGVTPEEWLRSEARYLPQEVVIKLEEIVRKNKSSGQTYTIIPN